MASRIVNIFKDLLILRAKPEKSKFQTITGLEVPFGSQIPTFFVEESSDKIINTTMKKF